MDIPAGADGKQDIFDAAIAQLVHDPEPELGPFVLLEPPAGYLFAADEPNLYALKCLLMQPEISYILNIPSVLLLYCAIALVSKR